MRFALRSQGLGVALLLSAWGCAAGTSSEEYSALGSSGGEGGQGGNLPTASGGQSASPGTDGGGLTGLDGSTSGGQACGADTKFVYVVDADNTMYRFDPAMSSPGAFTSLGKIGCKAGDATPNSMTVGRDGAAYVLYGNDDFTSIDGWACAGVYRVNIKNAACEGLTSFKCGSAGFKKFGMGFSTEVAQGSKEDLFVCDNLDQRRLGRLDMNAGTVAELGKLPGMAEFTGNGNGELWGFFPEDIPPTISQVDKSSGKIVKSISLAKLPSFGASGAFAFAYWGGAFYIFYVVDAIDNSTNVWKLETNGTLSKYISNTGLRIVGAGVSTCAPVEAPK